MIQNQKKIQKTNFFNELEGTIIEVATKLIDNGSYVIYKGILAGRDSDYVYLRNGEIISVKNQKKETIGKFERFAVNKSIIAYIDFG
jgi:hypothetical protein